MRITGIAISRMAVRTAHIALWSAWRFLRARHEGRRALANVIIAAGVLVAAAGGTAAFTGASGVVEWTNLAGVSLIFVGFLLV